MLVVLIISEVALRLSAEEILVPERCVSGRLVQHQPEVEHDVLPVLFLFSQVYVLCHLDVKHSLFEICVDRPCLAIANGVDEDLSSQIRVGMGLPNELRKVSYRIDRIGDSFVHAY